MPRALQHTIPYWVDTPLGEGNYGESDQIWHGRMRVVSPRRARKLRKRGVPLKPLHAARVIATNRFDKRTGYSSYATRLEPIRPNTRARYAWFVL